MAKLMYYGEWLYVDLASARVRACAHVTGGRVSPPGLASTARAGRGQCFILLKNNNSIILWITMSLWLNSQTRLHSIWMNCFCIFKKNIEDTLSKKSRGLQVSEHSRVSRVTPPTDWMTWAVTWLSSVSSLVRSARVFSRYPQPVKLV